MPPVANPAVTADTNAGDPALITKEQRKRALKSQVHFGANWIFLIRWLAPFPSCVSFYGGAWGGLVNYQDFPGRKTEPSYNSVYLLLEGTVRFWCHPWQEWPQCWREIPPSTGQNRTCPINHVSNALPRYPCVSKSLMHLWVNDFFHYCLKCQKARET